MASDAPKPALPTRYHLVRLLGRGSQAQTWLATDDERDGDEVAIKIFRLNEHADWKAFELFERECGVLRSLEHPGIPSYLGHGGDEATATWWLVMQYVPGQSLAQSIEQHGRHTDAQLRTLLERLLDVLTYLHELNPPVFHRDIKPANILVDSSGAPFLVDFGGVRALLQDGGSTVVGTFGYMAPEQLRGQSSPAADLYALGATMAAVASGLDATELPTQGLEIDLSACMRKAPLARTLAAMLPADPRARTQTAREAQQVLTRAFASKLPAAISPAASPLPAVRPPASVPAPRHFTQLSMPAKRNLIVAASAVSGTMFLMDVAWIGAAAAFVCVLLAGAPLVHGMLRGLKGEG